MSEAAPILSLRAISRQYRVGEDRTLEVLRAVDLDLVPGEIVGLIGPSGSGKSSLLHAAGLLEAPSSGEIWIDGSNCSTLDDAGRTALRLHRIGFVYQFHHLLPEFGALDNVALPMLIAGRSRRVATERATELLTRLGLGQRLDHQPAQLSGGEQQRVAIARALANRPAVILADEPTGNLDHATSKVVLDDLQALVKAEGTTALVATHNADLAARMDRRITLRDGLIVEV